jgi:hypothetical protein
LSLLLGQSWHHAIHVIENVIVESDDVMESNSIPFRHPLGPETELPQNVYDKLESGPLILYGEELPVIPVVLNLNPIAHKFPKSVV